MTEVTQQQQQQQQQGETPRDSEGSWNLMGKAESRSGQDQASPAGDGAKENFLVTPSSLQGLQAGKSLLRPTEVCERALHRSAGSWSHSETRGPFLCPEDQSSMTQGEGLTLTENGDSLMGKDPWLRAGRKRRMDEPRC